MVSSQNGGTPAEELSVRSWWWWTGSSLVHTTSDLVPQKTGGRSSKEGCSSCSLCCALHCIFIWYVVVRASCYLICWNYLCFELLIQKNIIMRRGRTVERGTVSVWLLAGCSSTGDLGLWDFSLFSEKMQKVIIPESEFYRRQTSNGNSSESVVSRSTDCTLDGTPAPAGSRAIEWRLGCKLMSHFRKKKHIAVYFSTITTRSEWNQIQASPNWKLTRVILPTCSHLFWLYSSSLLQAAVWNWDTLAMLAFVAPVNIPSAESSINQAPHHSPVRTRVRWLVGTRVVGTWSITLVSFIVLYKKISIHIRISYLVRCR